MIHLARDRWRTRRFVLPTVIVWAPPDPACAWYSAPARAYSQFDTASSGRRSRSRPGDDIGSPVQTTAVPSGGAVDVNPGWREPFGMVMIEALACGTPVIALPEGAAAEIVIDGENGMLVSDEHQMARAIDQVGAMGAIDPARCRASAAERYDIAVTATGYERVFRHAAGVERASAALAPHIESSSHVHPPQRSARR